MYVSTNPRTHHLVARTLNLRIRSPSASSWRSLEVVDSVLGITTSDHLGQGPELFDGTLSDHLRRPELEGGFRQGVLNRRNAGELVSSYWVDVEPGSRSLD